MAKKQKGKKKKEKKEKPIKTTKTQYIQQISEKNGILAQARKKTAAIEEAYFAAEQKYEQVQEDLADILKYLQHEIQENEEEIIDFDIKIMTLKEEIKKTDEYYNSIFSSMESEYHSKNQVLENQIQMLRTKLFTSEETKHQKEEYLRKKMEIENKIKEMETHHTEEMYEAEKLAIIKQDMMQKDMEKHLTSLAQDFTQASDIAIGETTNKLIRDNITLGNMLKCMQETVEKVREMSCKAQAREKFLKYNEELLDDEYFRLQKMYKTKLGNIENLLKTHEELTDRIKICQGLIKLNRRIKREIAENECILVEKNQALNDAMQILEENEDDVKNVENAFNNIRKIVLKLERIIYEAMRKVKHGIDVENISVIEERKEEALFEMDREEQKELLIEYKFKIRENDIEEILNKLSTTVSDIQFITISSESFVSSARESSQMEV